MSIFPTGRSAPWHPAPAHEPQIRADGTLAWPIRGEIYEIEEKDLDALSRRAAFPPRSGLVSRH